MTNISILEINRLCERLRQINQLDLNEVNFIDENGNVVDIPQSIINEWRFTGLNLTDFIDSDFYKTGFENNK